MAPQFRMLNNSMLTFTHLALSHANVPYIPSIRSRSEPRDHLRDRSADQQYHLPPPVVLYAVSYPPRNLCRHQIRLQLGHRDEGSSYLGPGIMRRPCRFHRRSATASLSWPSGRREEDAKLARQAMPDFPSGVRFPQPDHAVGRRHPGIRHTHTWKDYWTSAVAATPARLMVCGRRARRHQARSLMRAPCAGVRGHSAQSNLIESALPRRCASAHTRTRVGEEPPRTRYSAGGGVRRERIGTLICDEAEHAGDRIAHR